VNTSEGTRIHKESPAGRWAVSVPVAPGECRTAVCNGNAWRGDSLRPSELRVRASRSGGRIRHVLAGPNLRADGTDGGRTLIREISRADAERDYPATLASARAALAELSSLIRADADEACAEISRAITGEG
jgi:hypothetical protein